MPTPITPPTAIEPQEPDALQTGSDGDDAERLRELLGFAWRAPRRRPRLSVATLLLAGGAGVSVALAWPKTYEADVRLLARANLVLPALDNPNRAVPREADSPTKNVPDVILRHDNLVALTKKLALLDRWEAERPIAQRYKDKIVRLVAPVPSEAERTQALVSLLEKKIKIVTDEATISISVEWPSAQTAYDIASTLQKDFLDAKYDGEVATIQDAIAILEQHAGEQHKEVDAALTEFERLETAPPNRGAAPSAPSSAPHPSAAPKGDPVTDKALARLLDEKRAAIHAMETARDQNVADLERKMSEALITYTPAHPAVIALKERLEAAKRAPPELAQLEHDEATLAAQLGAAPRAPGPSPASSGAALPAPARAPAAPNNEDPAVSVGRVRLQNATRKYSELEDRIDAARIELDVAKAAFKYRFSVVRPAEVPNKPIAPKTTLMVAGAIVLALLLAFLLPFAVDLARGRVAEAWQIERRLRVRVLGRMDVT